MHPLSVRQRARTERKAGRSVSEIARRLGVGTSTVHRWTTSALHTDREPPVECGRCAPQRQPPTDWASYLYLLGQYLGDGHLVTNARVPVLRIAACSDYPQIANELRISISRVRGVAPGIVRPANSARLLLVQSYWTHWPCLLPQHGPGRKHERPILLEPWQQDLADATPWPLIRGLVHSDGCRSINTITRRGRSYRYQRYLFSNESPDIIGIFTRALDTVGVAWRMCRPNLVSVARRPDVAVLDQHIGPKT